jgi:hypothetical protein
LADVLRNNAEILPLSTDDGVELFVLNVRVIDALDDVRSSIMRFPDGRIMRVSKASFVGERIPDGVNLFRLPHRISSTYVSERFVDAYTNAGLRGFVFLPTGEG